MYGLKNTAILAYDNLKCNLGKFGYAPVEGTVGLWAHASRRTKFCVCVDDFGVQYWSKADARHLLEAIGSAYKYTVDYEGRDYCGLHFEWEYDREYVDMTMPQYVTKALVRLKHEHTVFPQFTPHQHVPVRYGIKGQRQFAPGPDTSTALSPSEKKHLQKIY